MSGIRFPFALSLAGHAVFLALLALFAMKAPPSTAPAATGGIEVTIAPTLPRPAPPPAPPAPPPPALPPKVETPPPPLPPPKVETPPPPPVAVEPPPAVAIEPPPPLPPPRKPAVRRVAAPAARRAAPARTEPPPAATVQAPSEAAAPPAASAPAARMPAPAASTEIAPSYRALLSAWLESHKQYPENARERGEEGHAVLRFAVDRSGRVIDYAVVKSSGYPDLDAALENMMRGATLPPFPAGMTQPSIAVAVTIRFSLGR